MDLTLSEKCGQPEKSLLNSVVGVPHFTRLVEFWSNYNKSHLKSGFDKAEMHSKLLGMSGITVSFNIIPVQPNTY